MMNAEAQALALLGPVLVVMGRHFHVHQRHGVLNAAKA